MIASPRFATNFRREGDSNHATALSRTLAFPQPLLRIKLGIEVPRPVRQIQHVKATTKRQSKTEAELLDHATNNLLRALKQDMRKKEGRVDYDKLRKEGYSDRLLAKLEQV